MKTMTHAQKDMLAKKDVDDWYNFRYALMGIGKYPKEKFNAFFHSAWTYAEATRRHRLIYRKVAKIINGLVEELECERKRIPGQVLYDAERLDCLFFCGYDPHFEGGEPPGFCFEDVCGSDWSSAVSIRCSRSACLDSPYRDFWGVRGHPTFPSSALPIERTIA